jgi:hypothetical protein
VESPSTLVLVLLKPTTVVKSLDIDETEITVVSSVELEPLSFVTEEADDDASTVVGLVVEVTCAYTVVPSLLIADHEGNSVVIPLFAVTVEVVDTVFVSV